MLVNCNDSIISNQDISSVTHGIYVRNCRNTSIVNNICNNQAEAGISIVDSTYGSIELNECNYILINGIELWFSENFTLIENKCNWNYVGSQLTMAHNTNFTGNTFKYNNLGVSLQGWYLISQMDVNPGPSDNCSLTFNLFQENIGVGLNVGGSSNCNIHHNSFIDNNLEGSSQACDDGVNNTWFDYSTLEGNYYSDYSGVGNYSIGGNANSTDPYPLAENPLGSLTISNNFQLNEFQSNPLTECSEIVHFDLISFISAYEIIKSFYSKLLFSQVELFLLTLSIIYTQAQKPKY